MNHTNILKLFEVVETQETLFLVMGYITGGEMFDSVLDPGHLEEKEASADSSRWCPLGRTGVKPPGGAVHRP